MMKPNDEALEAFAADPSKWGEPESVLTGAEAAAAARADLETAGLDVKAFERRMGRPRLGPGQEGTRSPRAATSLSPELEERLDAVSAKTGKSRSQLMREALEHYLPGAA